MNFKVWERELAEGKIDTSKVSVIWETPSYPTTTGQYVAI